MALHLKRPLKNPWHHLIDKMDVKPDIWWQLLYDYPKTG